MKKATFLFLLLTCCNFVIAQQQTITLKIGQSIADFKAKHVYKFPNFVPSRIIHKDGAVTHGKFNFNQFSDKIEFIGPQGDTLELINNEIFKEVILDKTSFHYDKIYYEIIKDTPLIKLGMRKPIRLIDQRKVGAMGTKSSATPVTTYDRLPDAAVLTKLTVNSEHVFSATPIYYFSDADFHFVPATKRNLLELLPHKKEDIANYLKIKQVNFTKLEDIMGLLSSIHAL